MMGLNTNCVIKEKGYYGLRGIKGSIGFPRSNNPNDLPPQWLQDIIAFRNEKYWEDIKKCGDDNEKYLLDKSYDKIDQAISFCYKLPIVLKNRYQILKELNGKV
jgi:hypothetical protein